MAKVISGPTISGTSATGDSSLFLAENSVPESGSKVKRVSLCITGGTTTGTLANITRFQAYADGTPWIDCPPAVLRSVYGFICKRAEIPTTSGSVSIDPSLLMPGGACPASKLLRFVLPKNGTITTPTLSIHEYLDDSPASGYPSLISGSANVPASAVQQPYNLQNQAGSVIAGIYLPQVAEISLLRYYDEFGQCLDMTSSAQIVAQYELYYGTSTFTDIFLPVRPSRVIAGVTRIEISTTSSWSGTANEIGSLCYVPNPAN